MTTTPSPINGPLSLVIHSGGKALQRAEVDLNARADHLRYDTQSDEARGGSGGNDGSEAV